MLLGGAVRTRDRPDRVLRLPPAGAGEPGESTPLEVARYCARMIEEHGADGFEGKVATVGLDEEVELVREVRAAIGPSRELRLDANGGWTVPTAREALRRLEPVRRPLLRGPGRDAGRARRAARRHHGVVLDARDRPRARRARCGVPDTIVTNLNELGGIRRTVEFVAACARFDVGFRFHCGETGVGSAAYLHVSAAVEHVREPSQTLVPLVRRRRDRRRAVRADAAASWRCRPGRASAWTLDRAALRRLHERYRSEGPFPAGGAGGYGGTFRRR